MELSKQQRLYLQTISDYFCEHGKWPTYSFVDRQLSRLSRDLDIEEISKSLPSGFASAFAFNHDLNAEAILSIAALNKCTGTENDLNNFLKVIRFCVDQYFNVDVDPVQVSSDDVKQCLDLPDLSIRKIGLLIKDTYDYPIYQSMGGQDPEYNQWSCILSRNIRYLDGITSIDQYLARLQERKKPSSAREKDQSPQLNDRHNLPSKRPHINALAIKDAYLFQMMVGELLQALGFSDVVEPKDEGGYDFQALYTENLNSEIVSPQLWIIEAKLQGKRISTDTIFKLLEAAQRKKADKILLVTNANLSSITRDLVTKFRADTGNKLEVWDRDQLMQLLVRFPVIQQKYDGLISQFPGSLSTSLGTKKVLLAEELAKCQPGQKDAYNYERICISILSEVFVPPLKPPKIQARTLNGIERRDALFSLRGAQQGWEELRQEFDAKFLLCEFKNYNEPFSKDEVNQTRNYLKHTIGKIGIIFSRKGASNSALRMRNSIYSEERKIILFFQDKHLIELLKMKEVKQSPLDLIQDAIDDFFISYE